MKFFNVQNVPIQSYRKWTSLNISLDIKRDDLLHDQVSGNKLRKLKYNLVEAQRLNHHTILTYGGAFSNHIAATAAAGSICGFKTIGVIRGEELGVNLANTLKTNSTLSAAYACGMKFKFVSRTAYRHKNCASFHKELEKEYGSFYNIPEGGTNVLAVKGTQEILAQTDKENYNYICVAAGTGGTAAGIINSTALDQKVIVFSALKGDFIKNEILKYTNRSNFQVINDITFGGYARSTDELIDFMNVRFRESGIPLEPIYTGKMMFGIEHLIDSGVISEDSRILAVHTGGLQGIAGYNQMLSKKGRKLITYEGQF